MTVPPSPEQKQEILAHADLSAEAWDNDWGIYAARVMERTGLSRTEFLIWKLIMTYHKAMEEQAAWQRSDRMTKIMAYLEKQVDEDKPPWEREP